MTSPTDTTTADRDRQALANDLAEVAHGSSVAMSRVYASTSAMLNAVLIRMLRDAAEAEDVLQEVYLTVWRRGASFDPARASPVTWLLAIARNRAIDRIRSGASRRKLMSAAAETSAVPDAPKSVADRIEDVERRQRLFECLDEMEERQRDLIRAAFFDGQTYEDLAIRENVPVGTMKSRMRRQLLRLRRCMDR